MFPAACSTSSPANRGRDLRLLVLALPCLLVAGCSGADPRPPGTPSASPRDRVLPEATASPAAADSVLSLEPPGPLLPLTLRPSDVRPIAFDPASPPDGPVDSIAVYDRDSGSLVVASTSNLPADRAPAKLGWLDAGRALVVHDGVLAVYDALTQTWTDIDGVKPGPFAVAGDGMRAAVQASGQSLLLLDLGKGTQQALGVKAAPVAWSPDGTKLLVRLEDGDRDAVIQLADPKRAYLLPQHLVSPNTTLYEPQYVLWLDADRVLGRSQRGTINIQGASSGRPVTLLETLLPSPLFAVSPDGRRIAGQDGTGPRPARVVVYATGTVGTPDQFRPIVTIEDRALGSQLDLQSSLWSPDRSRLLLIAGRCTEDERLVSHDIASADETVLASGGFYTFAFSPDGRSVAYTVDTRLFVLPADGSSQPRLVSGGVAAPAPLRWSPDGRFLAFQRFIGGYDRCN